MRTIYLLVLSVCCSFLACNNTNSADIEAAPGGKLYIRSFYWAMTNNLQISWIYLGNNGTIVMHPIHGNAPINIAEEKKDNKYTGTYKVAGDQMTITWSDGTRETWLTQKKKGIFTALNKGPVVPAEPLAPSYRFEEEFPASTFIPESTMHSIQFKNNGSCVFLKSPYEASNIADQATGTYTIKGNTIIVKLPGSPDLYGNIGIVKGGSGPNARQLVINTQFQEL